VAAGLRTKDQVPLIRRVLLSHCRIFVTYAITHLRCIWPLRHSCRTEKTSSQRAMVRRAWIAVW